MKDEAIPFRIDRPQPDQLLLVGELDVKSAMQLTQALEPFDGAAVTVDLSRLEFVDSSGLSALVRARRDHHGVTFVRPRPGLVRLAAITGLTDTLLMDDTEQG